MPPIPFHTYAVTVEDRPDSYALFRRWYRDADLVHEERFQLPKASGPQINTIHGLMERSQLQSRIDITDTDHETAIAVTWTKDGELVRRDAHVVLKQGCSASGVAAAFG